MDLLNKNNRIIFFFITWLGGMFGIHWFIQKNYMKACVYLFTCGGFVVCWIYDWIIALINIFSYKPERFPIKQKQLDIDKNKISQSHFKIDLDSDYYQNDNDDHIYTNNSSTDYKEEIVNNYMKNFVDKHLFEDAYTKRRTNKLPQSYVVIDVETTGLEIGIDRIIEISAIKYINNKEVEVFNRLVNPQMRLDPYITKLTNIKDSDLIDKQSIDKILPLFIDFIEDYTLVAHNAPFDIKMIVAESYRSGIEFPDNKIQDTLKLSKRIFTKDEVPNYKLETLKNYLGLAYGSHRALDDCYTCASIYQIYLTKK